MPGAVHSYLDELRFRGLLHQATAEDAIRSHLGDPGEFPRRAYVGFDPTADSLTIGNLVPIMMLLHLQRAGHEPVVVMGGGTGLIGDPSGKSAERQLMTAEMVAANVNSQRRIFENVFANAARMESRTVKTPPIVNNADWLGPLKFIEVLRDVGKHFSVNMMIQKESVKARLHERDQGISYTEFSYMILQSYDFLHLYREMGVTIQMGGSDQWGNIVGGIDLIRRAAAVEMANSKSQMANEGAEAAAFGVTAPLVTKADGGKFGKTESGAVWLTAERTSPYAFYQFWLNTADADVPRFLRMFTILPHEQVQALEESHKKDPGKRDAHRALARHATELLHGPEEVAKAEQAAKVLFGKGAGGGGGEGDGPFVLPPDLLASAPSSTHDRKLLDGPGIALVDLLPQTTLVKSKTEARTQLAQNAIHVNGRVAAADARVSAGSLLPGGIVALRRGKKAWHITRWE